MTTDNGRAVEFQWDIVAQVLPGRPLEELVRRHADWLGASAWTVVRLPEASVEARILARTRAYFDRTIERGLYVPITELEYEKIVRSTPRELPPPSRTRNLLRTVELGMLGITLVIGIYLIFVASVPDLWLIFFGLFAVAMVLGVVRKFTTKSR